MSNLQAHCEVCASNVANVVTCGELYFAHCKSRFIVDSSGATDSQGTSVSQKRLGKPHRKQLTHWKAQHTLLEHVVSCREDLARAIPLLRKNLMVGTDCTNTWDGRHAIEVHVTRDCSRKIVAFGDITNGTTFALLQQIVHPVTRYKKVSKTCGTLSSIGFAFGTFKACLENQPNAPCPHWCFLRIGFESAKGKATATFTACPEKTPLRTWGVWLVWLLCWKPHGWKPSSIAVVVCLDVSPLC